MGCEPEEKRCVDLLLLSVFDRAHILRGHGHHSRTRPRSLQPPAEFREVNIWQALERAVEEWSLPARPVPLRKWREGEPLEPGVIHTFAGTARELAPHLADLRPDGVISFLPRPNQAAWTLAAVWAEWLWGRAVSAPMAGTLQRRWFDWNWHARALTASAAALAAHLPAGTPVAGILGRMGSAVPRGVALVVLSGRFHPQRPRRPHRSLHRAAALVRARAGTRAARLRAAQSRAGGRGRAARRPPDDLLARRTRPVGFAPRGGLERGGSPPHAAARFRPAGRQRIPAQPGIPGQDDPGRSGNPIDG